MIAYILTMVIMTSTNSNISSFTVVYTSKEKCEAARAINREALTKGSVILATCTPQ